MKFTVIYCKRTHLCFQYYETWIWLQNIICSRIVCARFYFEPFALQMNSANLSNAMFLYLHNSFPQKYIFVGIWIKFYCYCCDVLILVHLLSDVREIELVKSELTKPTIMPILWTHFGAVT